MDISPAWRRVAFALIVCALVALGAYLIGPGAHRSGSAGAQHPDRSATTAAGRGSAAPSPAVAATPGTGQPDIYQWLPFTQAGLAAAASVVTRFGDAYGTYSYTESASAYVATMAPLASAQLAEQIKAAYSAQGVVSARVGGKQVSTGTATIESIQGFGASSLTFVVQVSQRLTAASGPSVVSTAYAITLTGNGTSWQVTAVELASVGNT